MYESARGFLTACAFVHLLRGFSGDGVGVNPTNVPEQRLRCLSCHSDRLPACYVSVAESSSMDVRACEPGVEACFTRFGPHEQVERECLVRAQLHVTHTCARDLCNRAPGADVPPPTGSQLEWKRHMSSMKEFMKNNRHPLKCVSCEVLESTHAAVLQSDCYVMPEERVQNLTEKCHRNEVCETVLEPARVMRGCTREPQDSAMLLCSTDECNNHVDIEQELRIRQDEKAAEEAAAAAEAAVNAPSRAILPFAFQISLLRLLTH